MAENIQYNLDGDVKNKSGISRNMSNIDSSLSKHKSALRKTSCFLGNTALTYKNAEKNLFSKNSSDLNFSSDFKHSEDQEIVAIAAKELGISEDDIYENIRQGLSTIDDVAEFIDGKATDTNKFVKNIVT